MKRWLIISLLMLSVGALSACGGSEAAAAPTGSAAAQNAGNGGPGQGQPFVSAYLKTDYEGALPAMQQLLVGTLKLEEGEQAVSAATAAQLLPLWQAIQGGNLQNAAERNAVLKQIERTLAPEQMTAIAAMQLTFADLQEWAKANGIELPQGFGQGFGQGGQGPFANLSEEERTKLRAELQNMTPEQRAARLRELGIEVPQGGFGQGQNGQGQNGQGGQGNGQRGGRFNVLIKPLVELLTERAAEQ